MHPRILTRRALANVAVAIAAGTASVAGVGLAQGDPPSSATPAVTARAPSGILAGIRAALEALVADGTINQHQADAVQQQADSGSIDPKTLVQSGAVSDAQMRIIANRIDQLKQAG
jgi:hypothetical protein